MNQTGIAAFVQGDKKVDVVSQNKTRTLLARQDLQLELSQQLRDMRKGVQSYVQGNQGLDVALELLTYVEEKWTKDCASILESLQTSIRKLQILLNEGNYSDEAHDAWYKAERKGYRNGLIKAGRLHLKIGEQLLSSLQ